LLRTIRSLHEGNRAWPQESLFQLCPSLQSSCPFDEVEEFRPGWFGRVSSWTTCHKEYVTLGARRNKAISVFRLITKNEWAWGLQNCSERCSLNVPIVVYERRNPMATDSRADDPESWWSSSQGI
jgi:hypothetical protein